MCPELFKKQMKCQNMTKNRIKTKKYCQNFDDVQVKIQCIGKMHKEIQGRCRFVEEKCNCILKRLCYNCNWLKK